MNLNHEWQTNYVLNDASSYLKCSGVFNQIDIGLYHKNGDCGAYFYYNPHRKLWECGPQNRKDYCLASRGGPSTFYWRSESDRIETLRNGETISVPLANPAGETAILTCGGMYRSHNIHFIS